MGFVIKKYSASGTWTGEPVKALDTQKEAREWLEKLQELRMMQGYDSELLDSDTLEVTAETMADAFTYTISED